MKMKTGPKVALLAILFVGLGYWAGRGFPRTWDEFIRPGSASVAEQAETGGRGGGSITARRVNDLEDRVTELERIVSDLRSGIQVPVPAVPGSTGPILPPQVPPMPGEEPMPEMVLEGSLSVR